MQRPIFYIVLGLVVAFGIAFADRYIISASVDPNEIPATRPMGDPTGGQTIIIHDDPSNTKNIDPKYFDPKTVAPESPEMQRYEQRLEEQGDKGSD